MPLRDGKAAGTPFVVKEDVEGMRPLAVTRDGALYYAVGGVRQNVYVAPLNDSVPAGAPVLVNGQSVDASGGASWSPDGKKIYYQVDYFTGSSRPGRVIERDLTTTVERDVFVRTDGKGGIFVSPDGQKTAVQRAARDLSDAAPAARARRDPDSTVTVFTVSGGQPRIVSLPATVDNYESVLWTLIDGPCWWSTHLTPVPRGRSGSFR